MVYIEILVIVAVIIVFVIGSAIKLFTGWLGRRRYKPENDRSRLGEEERKRRGVGEDILRVKIPRSSFIQDNSGAPISSGTLEGTQHAYKGIFKHINRK